MSPITYIKQSIDELKKVQWPTREQAIRLTVYVIGASLIVGLLVGALDFAFAKLLEVAVGG